MIPLGSYLASNWRHAKGADYARVLKAAQTLDREVCDKHKITLVYIDDAARFRDLSEKEVIRAQRMATPETEPVFPQLGKHADPICRDLTRGNFYALVGTRPDRPLPVLTMNTAALYHPRTCIADLFTSRLLWSDHPDRDLPGVKVEIKDPAPVLTMARPAAIHTGTAWVAGDRRGQGIGELVSRLHRLVAYLKYGPMVQFATIVPGKSHDKLFHAAEVATVFEKFPTHTVESRVLFYAPEDLVRDAEQALTDTAMRAAE